MHTRLLFLAVSIFLALPVAAENLAEDWLVKMNQAENRVSFEGELVYQRDEELRSMHILRRANGDGVRELISFLSGEPYEYYSDDTLVNCMAAEAPVQMGKTRSRGLVPDALFDSAGQAAPHYQYLARGDDHVAGRTAALVEIKPADPYRYGYRLWIDKQNGLLLRSAVLGPDSEPVEQMVYTNIRFRDAIPDQEISPPDSAEHAMTRLAKQAVPLAPVPLSQSSWDIAWLPAGFSLSSLEGRKADGGGYLMEHRVYTDGLASLSIYTEPRQPRHASMEGIAHMGAVNMLGMRLNGFHITVVGDVPEVTIRKIGRQIRHHD